MNSSHAMMSKNIKKKPTAADRKYKKLKLKKKRARLVIHNLSFKANEDILREHFTKYGPMEEVTILKTPDGKSKGCAFLQFEHVQSAAKAVHYENLQPICDRKITIDWAVAKAKFAGNSKPGAKKESSEEVKAEEVKTDVSDLFYMDVEGDHREEKPELDDNVSEADEDLKEEIEDIKPSPEKENGPRAKVISNDVTEGKTVFLKNVPFSVTNDELKACMEQYGPVYYALVCIDPLTEHSKGTAFVKFRNFDDAEKCLSAGTELRLHDQVLDPHRALHRNEVTDGKTLKAQQVKDSRNLFLVKEGVILAGSPAAVGVSTTDMEKRLQMEQWKSQMLKNLNMFVSRNRLVVHNLPENLNDSTLRQIFKNHAGPKACIQEARIMRDLKNPDANGVGQSKGFGFVAFTTHQDALKALRSINNNPNIFSKTKRPIVAFSIENRVIVNAKERRVKKSRDNNPLWKENHATTEPEKKTPKKETVTGDVPVFSGVTTKPGGSGKLRSKFNLKKQAELHSKMRRSEHKQKKVVKQIKETKIRQKMKNKEIRPVQGNKIDKNDTKFNHLVNKYRTQLSSSPQTKSKWYDS